MEPLTNSAPTVSAAPRPGVLLDRPGTLIGPYKILRTLGVGGMGTVCRAEQQYPVKRQVALKIIKPGMDSEQAIVRFEAERQALALMDHPYIARVLDAGTTEAGRLYFVMELVEGVPITRYCDTACLGIPARLELFIAVCQAIQHAHQKGIIHRDIKPSNILVAEYDGKPAPKVIDFGIAKAVDQKALQLSTSEALTRVGTVIGTFEYMSPEQAGSGADVLDTRADIYSLGVLLFELLTGATPLERSSLRDVAEHEVLRRICEEDPPWPSTRIASPKLARCVRGDLDYIAIRALEKDPNRRYETVSALAADLRRHLNGEPVEACPPSNAYRLGKFARRYRTPLGAAALFVLVLAGAAVFSFAQAMRARRAEEVSTAVKNFLQDDVLAQASVRRQSHGGAVPDPDLKVRTALDRAAARIAGQFHLQPAVEASIRTTIGKAYLDLGLDGEAQLQLERARGIYRGLGGSPGPSVLDTLESTERVYARQGRYELASAAAREILSARRAEGAGNPAAIHALSRLAIDTAYLRKTDEARSLIRQALDISSARFGPEDVVTVQTLADHGLVEFALENWPDAEKIYAGVLEIRRRRLAPDDPDLLDALTDLSTTYHRLRRFSDAENLEREIVSVRRRVLGPEHPDTLQSLANLSVDLNGQGKFEEAQKLDLEILGTLSRVLGPEHPKTLQNKFNLAGTYLLQGRFDEAEHLDAQVLEVRQRMLGPNHLDTLRSLNNLAADYRWEGKFTAAEPLCRELLERRQNVLGPDHGATRAAVAEVGKVYRAEGNFAKAAEFSARAAAMNLKAYGPDSHQPQWHKTDLALDLARQGKYRESESLAQTAFDVLNRALSPADASTLDAAAVLVEDWHGLGQDAKAERMAREELAVCVKTVPDLWRTFRWRALLGASLSGQGRRGEALPLLLGGYDGMLQRVKKMDGFERIHLWAAAGWIADCYAGAGRSEESAAWRRKSAAR